MEVRCVLQDQSRNKWRVAMNSGTPGFHDWRQITGRSRAFSASLKWLSREGQAAPLHVLSARRIHVLCSTCLHWSVPPLHYLTSSFREAGKPRSLLWHRRRTGSVSLRDQQVRKSRHGVRFVVSWQYERHFCLVISNPLDVRQREGTKSVFRFCLHLLDTSFASIC